MLPPQAVRSGIALIGPDLKAPLTQWQPMQGTKVCESGAFAGKAACENYRASLITDAKNRLLIDAPSGGRRDALRDSDS